VSSCGAFFGAHTSVSTMMDVAGRQKNATVAHCSLEGTLRALDNERRLVPRLRVGA
jgi:hypothetical protein